MTANPPDGEFASQRDLDALSAQVAANRALIDALQVGAGEATDRADAARDAAVVQGRRIDDLELRGDLDRQVIAVLQAEGVVARTHAGHLEEALRSSRKIGAAIGIVMATRKVREEAAFEILRTASQQANRKLRDIADEVVETGDVSGLPDAS